MLTAVARASIRRFAVSLPLRPRTSTQVAARIPSATSAVQLRPFSSTRWSGEAAGEAKPKKAKTKTTKKKPAAKKKPAPKKRVAETPEQKAKHEIKVLKEKALLKEPSKLPTTAWMVYIVRELKGVAVGKDLGSATRAVAESFKALSTFEVERLQAEADANRLANTETFKNWVRSHTAEEIYEANRARARLGRTFNKPHRKIPDDRVPSRPSSAYTLFVKDRWASGTVPGSAVGASKQLGSEWKALSEEQRQEYLAQAAKDQADYSAQMKAIIEEGS
ncbi:uncharacterized protein DNG_03721 [Cephalotrichum gorgonifer]|uniref:HMG box domain-containing protein n=1 Tax=Cephalotrichum gorgonifer TaxID=2041049 RepID=A0AAE8STV1_9PEZI|nr:uncharacterized protein DNG_03721 [Cephalotrichum gorgonifer]